MTQQKIDIVNTEYWQAMYLNGKKVAEMRHIDGPIDSLRGIDILRALNLSYEFYETNNQDCKDYFVDSTL